MKKYIVLFVIAFVFLFAVYIFTPGFITPFLPACSGANDRLFQIELPEGFSIGIYSKKVPGARSMCLSSNGILYVGTRKQGNVYALLDRNKDFVADKVITIASNLNSPNGVALRDGDLYVAEISRVLKFKDINNNLKNPPKPEIVNESFPNDEHHGWKFIRFGPDDKLYIPVGVPCNVCLKEDKRYASIMRMNSDGSSLEVYAHGVRNTVGFDWNPQTGVFWFTDNGRDWMGDNRPPDELNKASKKGLHFGFPYCHGRDVQDPKYTGRKCSEFIAPELELGPHVAALGMRFYTGKMFPEKYRGGIFIAEHGSWNRSIPIGYRIVFVKIKNKILEKEVFAKGWLQGKISWGRPVDIVQMLDGSILVSDDKSGAIYRISFLSNKN